MWLNRDNEGNIISTSSVPEIFNEKEKANMFLGEALMKKIVTFEEVNGILPLKLIE